MFLAGRGMKGVRRLLDYVCRATGRLECARRLAQLAGADAIELGSCSSGGVGELARDIAGDRSLLSLSLRRAKKLQPGLKRALSFSLLWISRVYGSGWSSLSIDPRELARFTSVMMLESVSWEAVVEAFEAVLLGVECGDTLVLLPHIQSAIRRLAGRLPGRGEIEQAIRSLDPRLVPALYSLYTRAPLDEVFYKALTGMGFSEAVSMLKLGGIVFAGETNPLIAGDVLEAIKGLAYREASRLLKQVRRGLVGAGVSMDDSGARLEPRALCLSIPGWLGGERLVVSVCPYPLRPLPPSSTQRIVVVRGFSERGFYDYVLYSGVLWGQRTLWVVVLGSRAIVVMREPSRGLHERIAASLSRRLGGNVVLLAIAYTRSRLLNPGEFNRMLIRDIEEARERLVIVSPFLKKNIVERAVERGVIARARRRGIRVVVATLSPNARGIKAGGRRRVLEQDACIKKLSSRGVEVLLKTNMHFKAAIVDRDIAYIGSINPLSTLPRDRTLSREPIEDYMIRYVDRRLVEEIEGLLALGREALV